MYDFHGKKVLVAGGTGLIGIPLVDLLIKEGARVRAVSLDDKSRAHSDVEFLRMDLGEYDNCLQACNGMDFVFNLLCAKGSPMVAQKYPATMLEKNLFPDMFLLRAARTCHVDGYLLASSLAVYEPKEVFVEDDWGMSPSPRDWFAGWAKRIQELQAEAYRKEYQWDRIFVVRPANTYGPHDDFESEGAMVIPSLIRRAVQMENPFQMTGDGTELRDFAFANDVAFGMSQVVRSGIQMPVNLGSGVGVSIRDVLLFVLQAVEMVCGISIPDVVWDTSQSSGDRTRVLNIQRANSLGFRPSVSLKEGILRTVEWYVANRGGVGNRYHAF